MTDHALSLSSSMPTLLETKSDHCRLRIRFNRLSKERRLLTCLLILFAIIMCGLLVGIFILSWALHGELFSRKKNRTFFKQRLIRLIKKKQTKNHFI
jgi:hypothetical protein